MALIRLRVCASLSEPLMVAYTTLLESFLDPRMNAILAGKAVHVLMFPTAYFKQLYLGHTFILAPTINLFTQHWFPARLVRGDRDSRAKMPIYGDLYQIKL